MEDRSVGEIRPKYGGGVGGGGRPRTEFPGAALWTSLSSWATPPRRTVSSEVLGPAIKHGHLRGDCWQPCPG